MPHGFRRPKVQQRYAINLLDGAGIELSSAPYRIEIDRAGLLKGSQRFVTHATFANHSLNTVSSQNFTLVGFLANAGRGPSRGDLPAIAISYNHWTTVI